MNFPTRLPLAAHKTYNVVRFLLKLCNHIDPRPSRLICNFWTAPSRPHPGPILHRPRPRPTPVQILDRPVPIPPRFDFWTDPSHPGTISGPPRLTPARFPDRSGLFWDTCISAPYPDRHKGMVKAEPPRPPQKSGPPARCLSEFGLGSTPGWKNCPYFSSPRKKTVLPACLDL